MCLVVINKIKEVVDNMIGVPSFAFFPPGKFVTASDAFLGWEQVCCGYYLT